MVVQGFRTHHLSIPLPRRYVSGIHDYETTENVLLELDVGDATGIGYAFAFLPRQAEAIRAMVVDLAETLVGRSVDDVRAVWGELWRRINFVGQSGVSTMALATVDMALWDLLAQRAGMPLYRMLGAVTDSLPVYASGGWHTYSPDELVEEAQALAEQGFADYKIKIGHADPRVDIERVEYLLDEMGNDLRLMVDANQAWTVEQATSTGRVLGELGVVWLEEPVAVQNVEGSARVAAELDVPLAAGETVFTRHGFRQMIEQRAADVLMPNVARCGGPSQFIQVATLADSYRLPISSHTYTEVSAHLMAACPNAGMVEYIPGWWDGLFEQPPRIRNGRIELPDRPGLGFAFSERALREHSVDVLSMSS
jgi:L-alanine-DL-glutamate epimerase-like enolase superfamily enzyme